MKSLAAIQFTSYTTLIQLLPIDPHRVGYTFLKLLFIYSIPEILYKDQLKLIFSKWLRGKGYHEYQDLDPKLCKRAFWLGTFPSQNC